MTLPGKQKKISNTTILFVIVIACFAASCSTRDIQGTVCYKNTRTIVKGHSSGKFFDYHLKLKKKGYFKQFSRFFFLNMGVRYGSYVQKGDSIYLFYCNDELPDDLNGMGQINQDRIILFGSRSSYEVYFGIRKKKNTKKELKGYFTARVSK